MDKDKYRSTPEQIVAAQQAAANSTKPTAAELKAIQTQAKDAAARGAAEVNNSY